MTLVTCRTNKAHRHAADTACPSCEARILVRLDCEARDLRLTMDPDHRHTLVDGSKYAPAHRAIPGVERLWRADTNADRTESLIEAIEDFIDGYHTDGYNLAWDEGILYMYGPDYTHPDDA
jgi:hypothetical protein